MSTSPHNTPKEKEKDEKISNDKENKIIAVKNSVVVNPAHRAILEAIQHCGVYPPPMPPSVSTMPDWCEFRAEVLVPAVYELLLISFENRSEVLPNGKMADGSAGDRVIGENSKAKDNNGSRSGSPVQCNRNNSDCNTNGGLGNVETGVLPVVFSEKEFIAENDSILFELMNCPYPILNLQRLSEVLLDHTKYHTHTTDKGVIFHNCPTRAPRSLVSNDGVTSDCASAKTGADQVYSSVGLDGISSPSSVGNIRIRGEKLQAALRRIIVVSSLS